jgi:hypothetical protein
VYPTADEVRGVLQQRDWLRFVEDELFEGVPFVFRDAPELNDRLGEHLATGLEKDNLQFRIVGSARLGLSIAPSKFPAPFSAESDVDVIVVDAELFDVAWHAMLDWNYPRRYRLKGADWMWAKGRQSDLYWGWLSPARLRYEGLTLPEALKPVRDISLRWFETFQSLALVSGLEARHVSGRLYRTWRHASQYHVDGLRKLYESLEV